MELTTITEQSAVLHEGTRAKRYDDLPSGQVVELEGRAVRTLPRPGGELLARFGTVNDVHFGEVEAGRIDGLDLGPVLSSAPGEEPYPELMNRGAVHEMVAADLDAVVVKGDLTADGTCEQYERFLEVYGGAFGERMFHVRGNHESYNHLAVGPSQPYSVSLEGVTLAVIDTSLDGRATGGIPADTLTWLGDLAADTSGPILVMGHHHCWDPGGDEDPDGYFGIDPGDSTRFVELVARHPNIRGYFAGHTHRNRVRRFSGTGDVPFVEVASVKEFPGSWAEYRVYEGGIVQAVHRISSPEALEWSDRTRAMYGGMFESYAKGSMSDRCFVIPT